MNVPLNRIIAFAGPYISVFAAGIATWLVAKANVLGIKDLDQANVATQVSGALTFMLVAILSWLGQSKWLTGHHLQMAGDAEVQAAAIAAAPAPPEGAPADPEHEAFIALGEDLPDDEVEFANQPPGLVAPAVAPEPATGVADDDLPDDEEELSNPPDQNARLVPDAPAADLEDEAAFAFDEGDDVSVAPKVLA